jgi:N,N-dimethylformamidase
MLVGYVSDELYNAIPSTAIEFQNGNQSIETHSRASGAIYADLPAGTYFVLLNKTGYGAKRVQLDVSPEMEPYHFRLLSDQLIGYAWPKWVRAGEKSQFHVHSPEAYRIELWRYGKRKEFIRNLGWYDEHAPRATVQLTPDGDFSQTGVAWNTTGYPSPNHPAIQQNVTAPERTGLYYFHLKTKSGLFFSFPWIVAPRRSGSDVAILTSNTTWNAYNRFGGRSNYLNPEGLPKTPIVNARQELRRYTDPNFISYDAVDYPPLSLDRPEPDNLIEENTSISDPIEGRLASAVAPGEWRFLGWMEQQGLNYDLYADPQLHDETLNLDDYKILILLVHPEYWSKKMYLKVKDWVFNRGGRMLYLGGNGINCEVEFLDDDKIVYKNGKQLDQKEQGLESRFHERVESEASLLGVVFSEPGQMTSAPYAVLNQTHWAFSGTGLKNGDEFGSETLHERIPGGASGHETDKISPSSPKNIVHLAKGKNPDNGGADLTIYSTDSGGAVFSVGSITWVSSILVDQNVSTITANVLHRFFDGQDTL